MSYNSDLALAPPDGRPDAAARRAYLAGGPHDRQRLRRARRRRAALQSLLHAAHRPPRGGLSQEPLLAERGPRPLRARPPGAHDGIGARARPRPRRWLSEPHPPALREAEVS